MSRGLAAAVLGLAACLLAAAFAVRALYVPGLALLIVAGASELSVRVAARRARIELRVPPGSIEEGASMQLTTRVSGWRAPLGGGRVQVLPGAPELALWRLPGGRADVAVRPRRRGRCVVGPAAVSFGDPFGICSRRVVSASAEVLVLPRPEPVSAAALARLAGGETAPLPRRSELDGTEVDDLRPYRQGAPASRIHWPSVARTGVLLERRAHEEAAGPPLVALDTRAPASEEALDMAVRAAASLCLAFARSGGAALLLPSDRRAQPLDADLAAWPSLHAQLALATAGGEPNWRAAARAALVLWVMARRPEQLGAPRGARADFTVSPFPREGAVVLSVAGCSVQRAAAVARAA